MRWPTWPPIGESPCSARWPSSTSRPSPTASSPRSTSDLGVELIAVGTDAYGVVPVDRDEVADRVGPIGSGTAVLVKASNSSRLFDVAATLVAANAG